MKRSCTIKVIYTMAWMFSLLTLTAFFYPTISDAWNRYIANLLISEYIYQGKSSADAMGYEAVRQKAMEYNDQLFQQGRNNIIEYQLRISGEDAPDTAISGDVLCQDLEYETQLNILNNQMMGYLEIEKIGVSLPVYHYTSEEILAKGVGHLYGSSLPVGGNHTHAVLTGHCGLMEARLFTDLNKLELEDHFRVCMLGEELVYEVDQIKTVLPEELEYLSIEEGKDLVTLVTCTPYGINTHRLLVRGKRVTEEKREEPEEIPLIHQFQKKAIFPAVILGISGVVLLAAFLILIQIWRK